MKKLKIGINNLEQKENIKFPEFKYHTYDIEIFSIFDNLKKKYGNDGSVKITNDMDNFSFFAMQEDTVVKAIKSEGIDLSKNQEFRHYILPSTSNSYFHLLGWKILTINLYKIEALLTYQSERYLGNDYYAQKDNFCSLVEFLVFQFVDANNYLNEDIRLDKITNWVKQHQINNKQSEIDNIPNQEALGEAHLLSIPSEATPEQILNFWLILLGNNEKGEPYWRSKQDIVHFVRQNFEGFKGVKEIRKFNPNMNKSEIYQSTWAFLTRYGQRGTKCQYEKLLIYNFSKFKNAKHVYSNIKDRSILRLRKLFKELP